MPIYEYECEGPAKHRFEKWQSMKDDPVQECPECATPVHKIFHPAGIIFKGSGWYVTDSRKPAPGESKSEKSDKSDSKSESKDQAKSDSKTESKTESKSDSSSSSSSGSEAKSSSSSE